MSRRGIVEVRSVVADHKYGSVLISKMINAIMYGGNKQVASGIVYGALDYMVDKIKSNDDPVKLFSDALANVKPEVESKPCRVGGISYKVPVEVSDRRAVSLGMRWLKDAALSKKGASMKERLGSELLDAYNSRGIAVKKCEDNRKMAESNRAFAHFRWFNRGKKKKTNS